MEKSSLKSVNTDKYRHFLKLVTAARKTAGLSQHELARKLDKPQSYVSKYERGERRLDVIEFLEIANLLSLNTFSLFQELQSDSGKLDQVE